MNAPNPFKRNQPPKRDEGLLCYRRENEATVLALFGAIFCSAGDEKGIAVGALDGLSDELTVLAEYFDGEATLNPAIIKNVLTRMAERARAAAEVQRRVNQAESES
jgi:hypothetical protein